MSIYIKKYEKLINEILDYYKIDKNSFLVVLERLIWLKQDKYLRIVYEKIFIYPFQPLEKY